MDLDTLRQSFLKKFQEDSGDRLQRVQLAALDLEKPSAAQAAEALARELHTLKGEARILGLNAIGQMAHAAEDVLKALAGKGLPPARAIDLLLRACDAVADLLEDATAAKQGTAASQAVCQSLAEASGAPVPELGPAGGGAKSRRGPNAPPEVPSAPADAPAEEGASAQKPQDRSIRVNVEILDSLGQLAGDLLVESARAGLRVEELGSIFERFSRLGDRFLRLAEAAKADAALAKPLELLEGDLHLLRDDAFRFARRHADGVNSLHGNLAQMADGVAQARLVPLATVFESFPRAAREIARQQGKQVELVVDNLDVGVDRSMIADVRDALVHLVRNAIDHGLEAPEFREAAGKPPVGRLTLRARPDGDLLHVDVEDDGRGIDPDHLRRTAVAREVMSEAQAHGLSDREAIDLIFLPGFSTREQVSDLSGRGVGMDVVKQKVETLGGAVTVSSRLGRGTQVALRLPQSLALMRVLLFRLGDDVYGIPAADVEAVTRVKPADRTEVFGTLALNHRGKPVALVALGSLLGLNGGSAFDRPPAVVVRHGEERAALVVDGFVDEREVAVKPCGGEFLKGAPFVAGSAALEDGRVAVLLHVPEVMTEVRRVARPVTQAQAPRRLRILLVDDSPIARATETALVRALGHAVDEAQDGEEALARINAQPYDVVLTDIQMPKMDGIALTRALKSRPETARIPVVVLSSLAAPEDRRRGMNAGADAYLVKGEIGVEVIAETLERLT